MREMEQHRQRIYALNRQYTRNRRQKQQIPERVMGIPQLAVVRRVPRSHLVPGTVVWAHVPYEHGDGEKTRPAVVVARNGRNITLLPGTTAQSRRRFPGRYTEVADLTAAGLERPTGVRITPVTVDVIEVVNIAGALGDDDAARILPSGEIQAQEVDHVAA